jgi:UPF0271 protein
VLAVQQVVQIVETKTVTTLDGTIIPLEADTICIHGDGLYAIDFARALRQVLNEKGIAIQAPPVYV